MEKEVISGIYTITNIKNGKLYVGSSKNIYRRWKDHKNMLRRNEHHSQHLQAAWNKYGKDNFIFEVIEKCKEEDLLIREQYYIDLYCSFDSYFGYNESEFAGRPTMTVEQREYYAKIASEKLKGEGSWCNIYSEKQIIKLIEDLKTGEYSYKQLSDKHNISYDIVASVACHGTWGYLTKNISFPKPKKSSRDNVKLTENDVDKIINMILSGECNKKISEIYNVHPHTIADIRNHKTWIDKTKDLVFPKSPKSKAYDRKYKLKEQVLNLRNEFGYTYKEIAEKLGISKGYACALSKNND